MRKVRRNILLLSIAIACTGCGCTLPRSDQVGAVPRPTTSNGVIFVVDGAGGWPTTSKSLRQVIAEAGLPLAVEPFEWQHGRGRVIADQCDSPYARAAGLRLADAVCAYRQSCPAGAVYVVAHSAGCHVALAAVEALPPGGVDRLVLLSPSVSACYDLRLALRNSREGIDVAYSRSDYWYLGLWVSVTGTADRQWNAAAGRVGFEPVCATPEDIGLYCKLRQYPWEPDLVWTGNAGGHYGSHEPGYLRALVLPLLTCAPPCPSPDPPIPF